MSVRVSGPLRSTGRAFRTLGGLLTLRDAPERPQEVGPQLAERRGRGRGARDHDDIHTNKAGRLSANDLS